MHDYIVGFDVLGRGLSRRLRGSLHSTAKLRALVKIPWLAGLGPRNFCVGQQGAQARAFLSGEEKLYCLLKAGWAGTGACDGTSRLRRRVSVISRHKAAWVMANPQGPQPQ